ncbi:MULTISPECIES: hypothetical protein [Kitasatospora]|uniref:Uncharacterized protein n=1 Tax=Kitasatospora cathayae TaxID=3004092 RepID=A0ABY7PVT4_9ACTN|nr:hypothetical protein [Kitasatospora sp. HUAS 3-15]WBP84476.1 hypothetical protein O1G21_00475 [Kitasatospora sp. HUAS 3-15]
MPDRLAASASADRPLMVEVRLEESAPTAALVLLAAVRPGRG